LHHPAKYFYNIILISFFQQFYPHWQCRIIKTAFCGFYIKFILNIYFLITLICYLQTVA